MQPETGTVSIGSTPGAQAALSAFGLSKRFGGLQAIADVQLQLHPHRVLGIIGPNGAGKSTLINLLTGVYQPDRGRIELSGRDVSRKNGTVRARLGLMRTFQHTRVLTSFTVAEALRLGGSAPRARGRSTAEDRLRVAADFGLDARLDSRINELPYGTQKVLNLCLIALSRPLVVLLDEPFAGVTAEDVSRLSAVIYRLRDDGAAIALVEHDMTALMQLSDSVLVLDAGRVVMHGTPAEVRADGRVQEIYLGRRAGNRQPDGADV